MADQIRRVEYFYVTVPNKPGEGAKVLSVLRDAGVNLLVFSGFPTGRQVQLDLVPESGTAFKQAARKAKWKVTGPKRAFLLQGEDRLGALLEVVASLAAARINIVALDAVAAGEGRYGAILWVAPADYRRAAKAIGAT